MAEDRRASDHPDERGDVDEATATGEEQDRSTGLPPKLERWRRRSAAGAIMTGFALGLQEVFEPERKEPAIEMETSGVPPTDLPVDAELDGLGAKRSVVRIRPWLLDRTGGADGGPTASPAGAGRDAERDDGHTLPADPSADKGSPS